MKPEPRPEHPIAIGPLETLAFNDVSFQHQTANRPALEDISFDVSRGETIAFVGPSGSGKTTLVKLLVGLYRPHSGHIFYNGTREDEIDIDGLRERIGFVTQDAQLFSGSIRENLLFVNPEATDADCMDVLRQASVGSLLARADNGLDTVIGEGGVKVSGGEKQRLSIARALLRKPQLLVFDEATSSLDSLTEEEISQTIRDVAIDARCDYDSDRASPLDGDARRPHLRSGARPDRRIWRPRRTHRRQRPVLRDVAPAGWRRTDQPRGRCSGNRASPADQPKPLITNDLILFPGSFGNFHFSINIFRSAFFDQQRNAGKPWQACRLDCTGNSEPQDGKRGVIHVLPIPDRCEPFPGGGDRSACGTNCCTSAASARSSGSRSAPPCVTSSKTASCPPRTSPDRQSAFVSAGQTVPIGSLIRRSAATQALWCRSSFLTSAMSGPASTRIRNCHAASGDVLQIISPIAPSVRGDRSTWDVVVDPQCNWRGRFTDHPSQTKSGVNNPAAG